jgi:hypothetical protein
MLHQFMHDTEFSEIKDFLFEDDLIRANYAKDFGHMAHHLPAAVFLPESVSQLQIFIKLANRHKIKITCQGRAHSMHGQALCKGGVILDLKKIQENIESLNTSVEDKLIVPSNATWLDVVSFALKSNLMVPVLTDYLGLSIAGTLSFGGLGGGSYLKGSQADNVLSLDVLTAEGELLTCSKDQNTQLYHGVLCGLGQVGIIVRVTLPLLKLKPYVKQYLLYYSDQGQFLKDQKILYQRRECDHLKGLIRKQDGKWQYQIEAACFYEEQIESKQHLIFKDLHPEKVDVSEMSYYDFVTQVTSFIDLLSQSNKLNVPHPWYNALIPAHEISEHLEMALKNPYLTGVDPIIIYPMDTEKLQQKYFVKPQGATIYLLGLLYNCSLEAVPDFPYQKVIKCNMELYRDAEKRGGFCYPVGTVPAGWQHHFGILWDEYCQLKEKYDPNGILISEMSSLEIKNEREKITLFDNG